MIHSLLVTPPTAWPRTLGVHRWYCYRNLSSGSLWDEGGGDGWKQRQSILHFQKAKFTFLRCAILLKWEFRKELFGKLAWGQGLGAANDIFVYMVRCGPLSGRGLRAREVVAVQSPQTVLRVGCGIERGSPEGV